jgi:hypothetical protein
MTARAEKTTTLDKLSPTNLKWLQVIDNYITNGRNLPLAYQMAYPDCKSVPQSYSRLLKNSKFKALMADRMHEVLSRTDRTVGELDAMYQKGFDIAVKTNNPSGIAANATGIARLYGLDKDNSVNDPVTFIVEPRVRRIESSEPAPKQLEVEQRGQLEGSIDND